jgi:hypothetical protein
VRADAGRAGHAAEVGTIYQACGFDFVGVMRLGGRALVRVNGKYMSERQAGRLAGTRGARALARLGFDVTAVPRRGRYFAFRGRRRKLRRAIGHLIQPYPKWQRAETERVQERRRHRFGGAVAASAGAGRAD